MQFSDNQYAIYFGVGNCAEKCVNIEIQKRCRIDIALAQANQCGANDI